MQLTDEQQKAVAMARKMESFKVSALAGTGKTSTLVAIAQAMGNRRGLYLAFNAAIAAEAKQRFRGTQCESRTFHSLAYRACGYKYKNRMHARLTGSFLRRRFGVNGDLAAAIAETAMRTIRAFLRTVDPKIEAQHVRRSDYCRAIDRQFRLALEQYRSMPDGEDRDQLRQHIALLEQHRATCHQIGKEGLSLARRVWDDMEDPNGETPIVHDFYLREYVLSQPDLGRWYRYLLFDEAQDADPLMLFLTQSQRIPVFYVGDAYQQIYEWRGAANAMESLDLPESTLTLSFRFGQAVADDANDVLDLLGSRLYLRGNPEKSSLVRTGKCGELPPAGGHGGDAIVVRTNAEAVQQTMRGLMSGRRVGLCGAASIRSFLQGYQGLIEGNPSGEFVYFQNEQELREFAQTDMGQDLHVLVKLVDEYGIEELERMVERAVDLDRSTGRVDISVTTAHKSKGLEFDGVFVSEELFNPKRLESDEEKRLLYVAKTRAKQVLCNARPLVAA
ncbi:ATP-dependent helicase [Acidithiobacillus caldus]|uniref:UvrD-helicase domain-containing protein n=1 Tax=Acidithiobacillus caldus TaxID=33059 RepID=UPI001C06DD10|nr:UvrD-helicase domain-containing protein [Acidithiobacillus caldus]MBU2783838.1 ATP-dependent helicase [Acidithiobacillus caldus]